MYIPQPGSRLFSGTPTFAIALATVIALLPTPGRADTKQLTTTPTSLSYGSVAVGAKKSLNLTLRNSGHTNTTVMNVVDNKAQFTIAAVKFPKVLAPGATLV